MNSFDYSIIHLLDQFAQRSRIFDYSVQTIADSVISPALLASLLWWIWFRHAADDNGPLKSAALLKDRQVVVTGGVMTIAALFVARAMAAALPYRQRPFANPALHIRLPFGTDLRSLFNWSSFPSDHATYFFAFGMLVWCASRRMGAIVLIYCFSVLCLPLVYMGQHYPTDILAGAFLGLAIGGLTLSSRVKERVSSPILHWAAQSPGTFFPCFFLMTFLMAVMFEPLRDIAVAAFHGAHYLLHGGA